MKVNKLYIEGYFNVVYDKDFNCFESSFKEKELIRFFNIIICFNYDLIDM